MERNILISEIVKFCFDYNELIDSEIKAKVESRLKEPQFVETLINTIYLKAADSKNFDIEKLVAMLLELEKIRLELEYKNRNLVSSK